MFGQLCLLPAHPLCDADYSTCISLLLPAGGAGEAFIAAFAAARAEAPASVANILDHLPAGARALLKME
jgi:hypothetical protein